MKIRLIFFLLSTLFFSFNVFTQTPSISSFSNLSGTFVGKYEKLEVKFDVLIDGVSSITKFNNDATYNLFNPDVIKVDVDFRHLSTSTMKQWPAFFYRGIQYCSNPTTCSNNDYWQSKPTDDSWRLRFTPDKEGWWQATIKVKLGNNNPITIRSFWFNCTPSNKKGFAKISNNTLEYSNGDLTMAVAENIGYSHGTGSSNPPNANSNFVCNNGFYCYNRYAKGEMERWFDEFTTSGGNYARVWFLPYSWELEPWGGNAGNYDERQNRAFEFDELLESSTQKDLLIHLVLSDRDALKNSTCLPGSTNVWPWTSKVDTFWCK